LPPTHTGKKKKKKGGKKTRFLPKVASPTRSLYREDECHKFVTFAIYGHRQQSTGQWADKDRADMWAYGVEKSILCDHSGGGVGHGRATVAADHLGDPDLGVVRVDPERAGLNKT